MKKIVFILLGLVSIVSVALLSCESEKKLYHTPEEWVADVQTRVTEMNLDTLHAKVDRYDEFYLIDVREPMEYYPGYIPSAVNIPNGLLIFKVQNDDFWEGQFLYTPAKDDEIVVYCKKGNRSIMAADKLQKLGYTNVKYVVGGWLSWEDTHPTLYEAQLEKMSGGSHDEVGGC